jgi:hypothetical protein
VTAAQIAALAGLGAFHGVNPAMGWLFAVARGLQDRSQAALWWSLPPIAAGHLGSVAAVAVVVTVTGSVLASSVVAVAGGAVLVGFGLWRLLSRRHFRWVGMRLSARELAGWSFLMSSAHGAGLMLLPVLVVGAGPAHHGLTGAGGGALAGLAAVTLHTLAMFLTAGVVALLVFHVFGVGVLRRAWFNVDRLWAAVLIAAGVATVIQAA